jgi:hypothetical protein
VPVNEGFVLSERIRCELPPDTDVSIEGSNTDMHDLSERIENNASINSRPTQVRSHCQAGVDAPMSMSVVAAAGFPPPIMITAWPS